MPQILGVYNFGVPGGLAEWTPGPVFRGGDTLRVQALGAIAWGMTGGGSATEYLSPATFTTPGASNFYTVTFSIPAGTYSAANWNAQGSPVSLGVLVQVKIGTDSLILGSSTTAFNFTDAATANQLADINAAAGGTLTVLVGSGGNAANITSFSLALTGSGGSIYYALPEGGYPPSYPSSHAYDPTAVLQNSGWAGSALIVSNTVPISLAAVVWPDGMVPPFASGYTQGLRPNEDTTFQNSDLYSVGATEFGVWYRIWFIFNGGVNDFANYSGDFALTVTRYGGIMARSLKQIVAFNWGLESTSAYGTKVPCTRWFTNLEQDSVDIKPDQEFKISGTQGLKFSTKNTLIRNLSKVSAKGRFDYQNFMFFAQSAIGNYAVTPYAPLGTAISGCYQHVCEPSDNAQDTFQSYTSEQVFDSGQVHVTTGIIWAGIKVGQNAGKEATLDLTGYGLKVQTTNNGTPWTASVGQNDVQTFTVLGAPTSANLQIGYKGQWTTVISYTSTTTAAAIQSAVQALSTVGSGNLLVTGAAGGPYTFTAAGSLAGIALEDFTCILSNIVGGTTPTAGFAHTLTGGMKVIDAEEVGPNELQVSFATTLAGLDSAPTVVVEEYETSLDFPERTMQNYRQNPTDIGPAFISEKKAADTKNMITLLMAHDATIAEAFMAIVNAPSGSNVCYVRLKWVGSLQMGVSGYYPYVQVDLFGSPTWTDNKGSEGNIMSCEFKLDQLESLTGGFAYRVIAVNQIPAYNVA